MDRFLVIKTPFKASYFVSTHNGIPTILIWVIFIEIQDY